MSAVSGGPVDWGMAERVAIRVAGREPLAESYHYASLGPDFAAATAEAEDLVAVETGLRSFAGPARARVVDRAAWIRANVASFQRLLAPVLTKLEERLASGRSATPGKLTRRISGAEVGALLGWMSGRVLGQYDLLVVDDAASGAGGSGPGASGAGASRAGVDDDQDVVYYVGPNVLALEKRFAFPPEEFRLWLALHEVTHRAQFTGVPWLRPHFLGLVHETLDRVDPDPQRFVRALREALAAARRGEKPLRDGGIAHLVAGPEQRELLNRISGLMSLLEGHGDVTMARAGAGRIPSADRFARVLSARRESASLPVKVVQRLTGLEAKLNQYEQGERFLAAIEAAGGPRVVDRCWESPDNLPSLDEIRNPERWLARLGVASAAHV